MQILATLTTLATVVSAALVQKQVILLEESEKMAHAVYGDNPVFKSLTEDYSTHFFNTGKQLQAWLTKPIKTYKIKEEMSPKDIAILQVQRLDDIPFSDIENLCD
jgi:hypothetical protein